jgi:hypothetical protein
MDKIQSSRLDANETFWFARELEYIKAKSYDIQFPKLKALAGLMPISTEAGPGAEAITFTQYEPTGMARVISNYADDLPRADIRGKQFTSMVKSIGVSYGYSMQEIRNAMFAGKPLQQRQANAARLANDQKVNRLAWFGDSDFNLQGFLYAPNVPAASVPNDGTGPSTLWVNKTPDQILRDMNELANGIVALTNGVESPDTLILPIAQYTLIASTPRSANSDTTILEYFLQNNPFITNVDWVYELTGAGPLGVDIMVAYENNPDKFTLEIPMPYTQYAPQERNLEFEVPCESRFGGVIIYYPLSLSIGEGI